MMQSTTSMPRRKGPPAALRLDTPVQNPQITLALGTNSASTSAASSAVDEPNPFSFRPLTRKSPSLQKLNRLSLTPPMDDSSSNSWSMPPSTDSHSTPNTTPDDSPGQSRPRRQSVASLFTPCINPVFHRKEEDGSPTAPYLDGPVQIIPGIWLGSEDNARDWKGLMERGIKTILNVAKEVTSPFDSAAAQPLRPFASTPNLYKTAHQQMNSTFYPAHLASGRPGMHYLKLEWSHGQTDLVENGFPAAMAFVDGALQRDEGVLIHCQCGISRSATLVIALVMRAAALCTTSVPPEVWALKGYHEAYSFVKLKSKWVGPNMSLIYQLLEYERTLQPRNASPTPSEKSWKAAEEEEEWGRRRRLMDEAPSDSEEFDHESVEAREARALDKAMEDRVIARNSSMSSIASSGIGTRPVWRSRYGDRKRAGSVASNMTSGSVLSENLVEEDEEEELLGAGGGFDDESLRHRSSSRELESASTSGESQSDGLPSTLRAVPFMSLAARALSTSHVPPSVPAFRPSFQISHPPRTATRPSFDMSSQTPLRGLKSKRRPAPLGFLPPAPPSSMAAAAPASVQPITPQTHPESQKPSSPPQVCKSLKIFPFTTTKPVPSALSTPSQTLFVFPPDSTPSTRTPTTMTLTSNMTNAFPFPTASTPRISTFRSHGRTKSFIGIGILSNPTTACSRVDARGWIGL